MDILSLPISTAGFPPRAVQPDLKGWVPGEEEDESVESSIVPSLHLLQGAVLCVRFNFVLKTLQGIALKRGHYKRTII